MEPFFYEFQLLGLLCMDLVVERAEHHLQEELRYKITDKDAKGEQVSEIRGRELGSGERGAGTREWGVGSRERGARIHSSQYSHFLKKESGQKCEMPCWEKT